MSESSSAPSARCSSLTSASATQAMLERYGLAAKYKFGQNFLVDDRVLAHILSESALSQDDTVLEIGPGIGTLTEALLARAGKTISIEVDRGLQGLLEDRFEEELARGSYELIFGDVLKVGSDQILACGRPNKLVANLPYQVAATVVLNFLLELNSISDCVVMVQKEVADRMAAPAGTKTYGAYSAKLGLLAEVVNIYPVGRHSFYPQPRVDSAVIHLRRRSQKQQLELGLDQDKTSYQQMFKLIDAVFASRRKTLINSAKLSGLNVEALAEAMDKCAMDPKSRAEIFSPFELFHLMDIYQQLESAEA